jgi:hypothetical protein
MQPVADDGDMISPLVKSIGKDFNHEIHQTHESGHRMNLLFIFV